METGSTSVPSSVLRPLRPADLPATAQLIGRAMNLEEQAYAERVFAQYFESQRLGIDDGRSLLVLVSGDALIGITGLHHYAWGPPENVWLSWFAVDPVYQGRGFGSRLLHEAIGAARSRGFRKMFIETYSSATFERARGFYTVRGFKQIGVVENYLPDGAAMIVYGSMI